MGPNLQNLTLAGRVAGFVLKNPSYPTHSTKPQRRPKSDDDLVLLNSDLAMFGLPLLSSAQILTQICLNPTNLAQIYSNLAKLW